MERTFFRGKQPPQAEGTEQYRIGVTGLGRGVGTTFVAAALAFYFRDQGRQVSFTECLRPDRCVSLLYDQVAMDKRFSHRTFEDVYRNLAEEEPILRIPNREAGIIWRLATPEDCNEQHRLTPRQQARLIAAAREEVCIFDMEADYSWDDYLMDMDVVFVVTDPLPSRLIRSRNRYRTLKKMELAGCRVIWVVNKTNAGVDKKQVKNYLKGDNILWVEGIDRAEIYEDEYFCRFHWENDKFRQVFLQVFAKVPRFHSSLSWFSISKDVEI